MIKVVVVDDHELFREGLVLVLNQIDDIEIVADFGSGNAFLQSLDSLELDIVLMDIKMEGLSGIETTIKAKATSPT